MLSHVCCACRRRRRRRTLCCSISPHAIRACDYPYYACNHTILYMRNILHNARVLIIPKCCAGAGKLESVESAQDTLRAAHSTFLACINLKAAADSAESNHVIKTLTVLLAFTTPLNLIFDQFVFVLQMAAQHVRLLPAVLACVGARHWGVHLMA
eukprot:COSAG01_NODE_4411_length_5051_cov_3.166397_4_plen_155_part_00